MRYAVLGTGIVGQTIAGKLVSLGHDVVIGTRNPQDTLARTDPDGYGNPPFSAWHVDNPQARLAAFAEAAAFADVVVNATNGAGSLQVLTAAGAENLAGKVLVDIANPLDGGTPPSLDPVNTDSLAEQIQRAFPETRVVKTLNTMNCAVMTDPARVPGEHNVFVSGNDAEAKKAVTELLASFGWPQPSIIDLGDISTARGAEMQMAMWLRVWGALGHMEFNFHIAGAHRNA